MLLGLEIACYSVPSRLALDAHCSPKKTQFITFRGIFKLGLRPQANIKDDLDMYKAYQGYCRFMPGGGLFLNYWRRCSGFPEKVQWKMREHWLEEVDFLTSLIDEKVSDKPFK